MLDHVHKRRVVQGSTKNMEQVAVRARIDATQRICREKTAVNL